MADPDSGEEELSSDKTIANPSLQAPVLGMGAAGSASTAFASGEHSLGERDSLIGKVIAERYQIESLLGEGGMASVYLATHVVLGKKVAIKLLHRSSGIDEETITRFQQEASGIAVLRHPNLIGITDLGLAETGHAYCVMDLVEGKSLADLILESPSPQYKRLAQLFADVCRALDYAHSKNIIHRDLKPSNIIVEIDETGKWIPKLIDFGIAKFGDLRAQITTRTGVVFGSPYYMSPEQCEGGKLDQRSDIYSLGCTMYEAVAGKPPFSGRTALQTLSMHAQNQPPALHAVRPDVPDQLERVILKCLAKASADRYQSARELESTLRRVDLRSARRVVRDKWLKIGGCAFVVVAVAAYVLWQFANNYSNDLGYIDGIDDPALLRTRIDDNKNDPRFDQHVLAALYTRLLQVEGTNNHNALKDSLEAYKRLIAPKLREKSFYTWYIASFCGYMRFKDLDLEQAANCERVAVQIYDDMPLDMRTLCPSLLENNNIIVADLINRDQVDKIELHAQVERSLRAWKKIVVGVDPKVLKAQAEFCAPVFHEIAARCERAGDIEDAITCYRQASAIFKLVKGNNVGPKLEAKAQELSDRLSGARAH